MKVSVHTWGHLSKGKEKATASISKQRPLNNLWFLTCGLSGQPEWAYRREAPYQREARRRRAARPAKASKESVAVVGSGTEGVGAVPGIERAKLVTLPKVPLSSGLLLPPMYTRPRLFPSNEKPATVDVTGVVIESELRVTEKLSVPRLGETVEPFAPVVEALEIMLNV